MRRLICPTILMLFLHGCAQWSQDSQAAAILDAAQKPRTDHVVALTGKDLDEMRRTGLVLVTILNCWPDGCPQ